MVEVNKNCIIKHKLSFFLIYFFVFQVHIKKILRTYVNLLSITLVKNQSKNVFLTWSFVLVLTNYR